MDGKTCLKLLWWKIIPVEQIEMEKQIHKKRIQEEQKKKARKRRWHPVSAMS